MLRRDLREIRTRRDTQEDVGINVFTFAAGLATLISDARMNAIDKYSPQIPPTAYG